MSIIAMPTIAMPTIAMPTYSLLYLGSHFGEQSVSDVEGRVRSDWARVVLGA